MVQIRKLKPSIEIAPPRRTSAKAYNGSTAISVERRLADHPAPTPQPTPCRLWQGAVDNHGYGTWHRYIDGKRDKVRPHRWVMEQLYGELSDDQVVMHMCDQPLCYRVEHLRIGTIAENNADMKAKGRLVPRQAAKAERRLGGAVRAERDDLICRIYAAGIAPLAIAWMLDLSYQNVVLPALAGLPYVRRSDWERGFPSRRGAPGGSGRLPPERTSPVKSKEKNDVPRRTTVPQHDDDEGGNPARRRPRDGVADARLGAGRHDDRADGLPPDPLDQPAGLAGNGVRRGRAQDRRGPEDDHRVPGVQRCLGETTTP